MTDVFAIYFKNKLKTNFKNCTDELFPLIEAGTCFRSRTPYIGREESVAKAGFEVKFDNIFQSARLDVHWPKGLELRK